MGGSEIELECLRARWLGLRASKLAVMSTSRG